MDSGEDLITVEHAGRALRFRPPGGRVEATLRGGHFYEQSMLEYIEALALPGVYADVGAYVGTHALFFAAFCPASRVLAFEPRPHVLEHLRRNLELNQMADRVEVHPIGLSDRDETVRVLLDGRRDPFACRRLDDVVSDPVALIKLDVEGMEEKVLAGAQRILASSRPLLFAEAHDGAALASLLAALAPHGYHATGRVFNDTATYELAADESRLPTARSLLEPAWWIPDSPALSVELGARLRIESRLGPDELAHVTAAPIKMTRPPREAAVVPTAGAVHFLQATGEASRARSAWIYLMEYRGGVRTHVQRVWFVPHLFRRVDLQPDTETVRVVIRLGGPGVLEIERLAFHTLVR